jgi:hypothetical protein
MATRRVPIIVTSATRGHGYRECDDPRSLFPLFSKHGATQRAGIRLLTRKLVATDKTTNSRKKLEPTDPQVPAPAQWDSGDSDQRLVWKIDHHEGRSSATTIQARLRS